MRRSRSLPMSAVLFALVSTASVPAFALPHRAPMVDATGHAAGCFRVDATQCCHAGTDGYHCHGR